MSDIVAHFNAEQEDLVLRAATRVGLTKEAWLLAIGWYCAAADKNATPDYPWPPVAPPPPPPPPPPPADPTPVGDFLTNPRLKFREEFDGDLSQWNVLDNSTFGSGNQEEETYFASQVRVANGALRLTAEATAGGRYKSGMVTTKGGMQSGQKQKFSFTQGYIEARIKMPKGGGYWPAFWLVGAAGTPSWPAYGEFDIVEQYGTHPEYYEATTHWSNGGVSKQQGGAATRYPTGSATDYHVYGLLWQPGSLAYTLDGKVIATFKPADPGAVAALTYEHVIHLNLAVGGTGPRQYHGWDGTWQPGDLPGVMEIDYVRVWQGA